MTGIISIFISALVTILLFLLSKIGNPRNIEGMIFLAQATGLATSLLISWNFILATRTQFLEKIFGGLDKVYMYHKIIGNLAFIFAISHPIFLILGSLPYNLTQLYLIPSPSNVPYGLGIVSLYLLITLISITIFIDLPYKLWKKTHEFIGLVIILGGLHSVLVSSDISFYLPLKIWMVFWNLIAIIAYVYKRFIYYLCIPRANYEVLEISQDKDYLLMKLKLANSQKGIQFRSGQFAFFSLENDRRDDHPFSILEQNGEYLTIGTKIIGGFTLALSKLQKSQKLNVYGPFGYFSNNIDKNEKMLWISGGIGITPFLSMARGLKSNQEVTMIHTSRSDEPHIFTKMFTEYTISNPKFKFVNYYSDKLGHLDEIKINDIVPLNFDVRVYLCGPQIMMETLADLLPRKGIMNKRIIFEDFSVK